jgi:hypothetical protein
MENNPRNRSQKVGLGAFCLGRDQFRYFICFLEGLEVQNKEEGQRNQRKQRPG